MKWGKRKTRPRSTRVKGSKSSKKTTPRFNKSDMKRHLKNGAKYVKLYGPNVALTGATIGLASVGLGFVSPVLRVGVNTLLNQSGYYKSVSQD